MFKFFIFIQLLAAISSSYNGYDDTFGTYFITSVLNYPNPYYADSCTVNLLFNLHLYNNRATVTVSTKFMGDQVVSITTGVGSLTLDCQDLIFNNYNDAQNSLYTVSDPRIKIVASTEIKVLVQVIIGNGNGKTIGDIYMVYPTDLVAYTRPTNFVGKQYTVKLPKATDGTPALISLMAFDNGLPITGYIAKYVDGNEVSRETFNLQTALGSDQAIYADGSSNRDVSYRIFANADFVVVAAVPCVDLSFASGNAPSGSTSSCDYAALTPLPILNYDCRSVIDRPIGGDLKGISTAFTNIIFELPFAVACSKNLLVSNYITDEGRLYDKVSVAMGKSIRLDPKKTDVFACESDFTQIKVVRLGGIRDPNTNQITSAFLTNVLDRTQWLYKTTVFYTPPSGSSTLEVCGDLNSNLDSFRINDKVVPDIYITKLSSYYVTCYIFQLQDTGYISFYYYGTYLAYVSGTNNDNSQSSYGYAIGFASSRMSLVDQKGINPGGDPINNPSTTSLPETTTKSNKMPTKTIQTTPTTTTPKPLFTTTKSCAKIQNSGLLIVFSLIIFLLTL